MAKTSISSAFGSANSEPRLLPPKKFSLFLSGVAEWSVVALAFLMPLFFLPITSDALEFPKQLILAVGVGVSVLALLGSFLVDRSVIFRRTVANVVVLVFLASVFVSAFASGIKYPGVFGDYGMEYQSLFTAVLFVLLFFVIVNLPDRKMLAGRVVFVSIIGGGLASLFAILEYSGVTLLPFAKDVVNLTGSTVVSGLCAAVVVVLAAVYFLVDPDDHLVTLKRLVVGVMGLVAFALAAVIDFWPIWAAIIAALVFLMIVVVARPASVKRLTWLALPMGVILIAVFMLIAKPPIPIRAPAEFFPTIRTSLGIAGRALAVNPVFGTGPGTFVEDYSLWRNANLNNSSLWYLRFANGNSYLTTAVAVFGFAGLTSLLALFVIGVWKSLAGLLAGKKRDGEWVLTLLVFAGWLAATAGIFLYGTSMASFFIFWLLFALLIRQTTANASGLRFKDSPRAALTITFGFVVVIVAVLAGWYVFGTRLASDIFLAQASSLDTRTEANLDAAVRKMETARGLDSFSDLIASDLSQAYLLKIRSVAADSTLDSQTRSTQILSLSDSAVRAALAATAIAGSDAASWANLGQVYETLAPFVGNAADEAIKDFTKAAELDPTSPVNFVELGKVYLLKADQASGDAGSAKNGDDKSAALKKLDDALTNANTQLMKALALKSDYAPAGYELALVLARQGNTKDAITRLETVRTEAPSDAGVAFELGLLYYNDNQKDKAQAELERSVRLLPTFANARWILSSIYEQQGQISDAIDQINEILKTDPTNQTVLSRLADLKAKLSGVAAPPATPAPSGSSKKK